MSIGTLPVLTQPDEPPNVLPCHTGKAARVCSFDLALLESANLPAEWVAAFGDIEAAITCISCGAPYGQPHASNCAQRLS